MFKFLALLFGVLLMSQFLFWLSGLGLDWIGMGVTVFGHGAVPLVMLVLALDLLGLLVPSFMADTRKHRAQIGIISGSLGLSAACVSFAFMLSPILPWPNPFYVPLMAVLSAGGISWLCVGLCGYDSRFANLLTRLAPPRRYSHRRRAFG